MGKRAKVLIIVSLCAIAVFGGAYLTGALSFVWGPDLLWNLIDLAAIAIIHIGSYLKIKKVSWGWMFSAISIVYFLARSMTIGLISQCFGHLLSLCLAIYGFIDWNRKEKEEKAKKENNDNSPECFYVKGILYKKDEIKKEDKDDRATPEVISYKKSLKA